jgi:hypothetical protein
LCWSCWRTRDSYSQKAHPTEGLKFKNIALINNLTGPDYKTGQQVQITIEFLDLIISFNRLVTLLETRLEFNIDSIMFKFILKIESQPYNLEKSIMFEIAK